MIDHVPGPAAGYVPTTDGKDRADVIALFAEDAVIHDAGQII